MHAHAKNPQLAYHLALRGWTSRRLADQANVHHTTVSALLNERQDPTPATAKRIARALGVKVGDIFAETFDRRGAR